MDDVDRALDRLRAADPAAEVDGTWAGPPAAPPAPPRRHVALLAGAAAVVVAGVALATVELRGSDSTPAGLGTAAPTSPAPTSITADDPHEQTDALLSRLLAGVTPLPGASPSETPPDPALKYAPEERVSPNLIVYHEWWTLPGTVNDVLVFYHAHPPNGMELVDSEWDTGTGHDAPASLYFDRADTGYARDIQVAVSVFAQDGDVAIGAYAQAIWIPEREPATLLHDVSSVQVVVTRAETPGRPSAPTVTRTLTGEDVDTVVKAVNDLSVPTPGVFSSCPSDGPGLTDELDLVTGAGTVHVVEDLTSCRVVLMTLPDGSTHRFDSGDLDATLMHVLGLPENYGRS